MSTTATTKATAAKKAAKPRATKANAAPVSPEAAAVTAYADAYAAWWTGKPSDRANHSRARVETLTKLCTLAGCADPGPGHLVAECAIGAELKELMRAVHLAFYAAVAGRPDRIGRAAAILTHRLTELTAA
jgi:hypothetical protein